MACPTSVPRSSRSRVRLPSACLLPSATSLRKVLSLFSQCSGGACGYMKNRSEVILPSGLPSYTQSSSMCIRPFPFIVTSRSLRRTQIRIANRAQICFREALPCEDIQEKGRFTGAVFIDVRRKFISQPLFELPVGFCCVGITPEVITNRQMVYQRRTTLYARVQIVCWQICRLRERFSIGDAQVSAMYVAKRG